jgi:hypothetical protein
MERDNCMNKCNKICYFSNSFGDCNKPENVPCPLESPVFVVRGEWIANENNDDGYKHHVCSICKEEAVFDYVYEDSYDEGFDGEWQYTGQYECGIKESLTNYCPNCGAKMSRG